MHELWYAPLNKNRLINYPQLINTYSRLLIRKPTPICRMYNLIHKIRSNIFKKNTITHVLTPFNLTRKTRRVAGLPTSDKQGSRRRMRWGCARLKWHWYVKVCIFAASIAHAPELRTQTQAHGSRYVATHLWIVDRKCWAGEKVNLWFLSSPKTAIVGPR